MKTKVSKYEILEEIAKGGFGIVYRARDPYIKRTVAVKTCPLADDEARQRFFREAEIAGQFDHPNVTIVHDFGIEDDYAYLVQEYLSGEDLLAKIQRRDVQPWRDKVEILIQVARGLAYAHSKGVVHRDIKPGNIRILEDGQVKIMDFGIAKTATSEPLTRQGVAVGTLGYLSPEQLQDHELDPRTDIFSFGVVAYELLSYESPFEGDDVSAVIRAVLHTEPIPLSVIAGCPQELETLVHNCLRKNREARPPNFAVVLAELEAILAELAEEDRESERNTAPIDISGVHALEAPPEEQATGGATAGTPDAGVERDTKAVSSPPEPPADAPTVTISKTSASPHEVKPPADLGAAGPRAGPTRPSTLVTPPPDLPLTREAEKIGSLIAAGQLEKAKKELQSTLERRESGEVPTSQARTDTTSSSPAPRLLGLGVAALVLVTALGGGWWWWRGRGERAPVATPAPTPAVAPVPVEPPPPPARGPVSIVAAPWAEVISVLDETGEAAGPAGPLYTPAYLELPPGLYSIVLSHPAAAEPFVCQVRVEVGIPATCEVRLLEVDAIQYFRDAGWWG